MRLVNRYTPASPQPFRSGSPDQGSVGGLATSRIPSRQEYDRIYSYCEGMRQQLQGEYSREYFFDGDVEKKVWMHTAARNAMSAELKFWRNELSYYRNKHRRAA